MKVAVKITFICFLVIVSGQLDQTDTTTEHLLAIKQLKNKEPPPIIIHTELATPQFPGFQEDEINSGPIVIVNDTSLFIPNVNFELLGRNAAFFIGENCTELLQTIDEDYYWKTVHLNVNSAVKNVKNLCVVVDNAIVASASIEINENVPNIREKTENTEILRIPKCCPLGWSYLENEQGENICVESPQKMQLSVGIFDHNETHLNDEPMNSSLFTLIPYSYPHFYVNCDFKIMLSPKMSDVYNILRNGSLIYMIPNDDCGVMPQGGYCIENNATKTQLFICNTQTPAKAAISNTIYVTLLSISTICYGIVAVLYYFWLYDEKDIHKRIFTIYAASMCFNCTCLIFLYALPGVFCSWLPYFIQFVLIGSFCWVLILCADVLRQICHLKEEDNNANMRLSIYTATAIGIGLFFTILSFIIYKEPNLPSGIIRVTQTEQCVVQERSVWLFTVPSSICLFLSLTSLVFLKLKVVKNNKDVDLQADYDWITKKMRFNFMCRACLIVICLMSVWILLGIPALVNTGVEVTLHSILAIQGLIILCISCFYKHIRKKILNKLCNKRKFPPDIPDSYTRNQQIHELINDEDQPMK